MKEDFSAVNYIDDLGGVYTPDKAVLAFNELENILSEIGILELVNKASFIYKDDVSGNVTGLSLSNT